MERKKEKISPLVRKIKRMDFDINRDASERFGEHLGCKRTCFFTNGNIKPKRELVVLEHRREIGVNVSFTSGGKREDRERYHSFTREPISRAKALRFIEGYLEAARKGEAYEPSL